LFISVNCCAALRRVTSQGFGRAVDGPRAD